MFKPFPVLLLFVLLQSLSVLPTAESTECIDPSPTRVRTFKSLLDYQHNKIAFNPANNTYAGNYIGFSDPIIGVLPRNAFVSYQAEHIVSIDLDNHKVNEIDEGAFLPLKCVMKLHLRNNTIHEISKLMFKGLLRVHELDLGQNAIKDLPEKVFELTRGLKKLNLTKNSIRHLHPDSFYNLTLLAELDLSYNYLTSITPLAFQYLVNLFNLQLGSNQLDQLDVDKWNKLAKLKLLNLSDNALPSFDLSNPFSFTPTLVELYLDENLLTKLNAGALGKHLPALKILDLTENPWTCEDLMPIIQVLNDSRIGYRGPVNTEHNVGGISCNRSMDTYERMKWVNPIDETTPTTTSPAPPSTSTASGVDVDGSSLKSVYLANLKILDSVNSLHTTIVCLFVVIIIFIFVDIAVRTGCLKYVLNRRNRAEVIDNSDAEDFSLLRDRF